MGKAACFFVVLSFDLARSQMVLLCHLMIGQPELGSESGPGHIHFTLQLPSFRSRHPGTAGLLRARLCSIQYLCPLAAAHQMPRTSIQPTVAIQRASCQLAYAGRRKRCPAGDHVESDCRIPRRRARRYSGLDGRSAFRGHAKNGRGLSKGAHHACWRRKTEAPKSECTRKADTTHPDADGKSQTRVGSETRYTTSRVWVLLFRDFPLCIYPPSSSSSE